MPSLHMLFWDIMKMNIANEYTSNTEIGRIY